MSRQREARGSFDGTGEGEAGEGGAAEVEMGSVGSMRYLISFDEWSDGGIFVWEGWKLVVGLGKGALER